MIWNNELQSRELRDDILKGLELSFQRLIIEKKKSNSKLAFVKKGKVLTIDAVKI